MVEVCCAGLIWMWHHSIGTCRWFVVLPNMIRLLFIKMHINLLFIQRIEGSWIVLFGVNISSVCRYFFISVFSVRCTPSSLNLYDSVVFTPLPAPTSEQQFQAQCKIPSWSGSSVTTETLSCRNNIWTYSGFPSIAGNQSPCFHRQGKFIWLARLPWVSTRTACI